MNRARRWLWIINTLLLIICTTLVWWSWRQSAAIQLLESKWAAARAAGDPTTCEEILGPPLAPEENAAHWLDEAGWLAEHIDNELQNELPPDTYVMPPDKVVRLLAKYPRLFETFDKALACQRFRSLNASTRPDPTKETTSLLRMRTLLRVVQARLRHLLDTGRRTEAIDDCIRLLKMSRVAQQNPGSSFFSFAGAVRAATAFEAEKVLRGGSMPQEVHQRLDDELALSDTSAAFVQTLKHDRVLIRFPEVWNERTLQRASQLSPRGWCTAFDLFERAIATADVPFLTIAGEFEILATSINRKGELGIMDGETLGGGALTFCQVYYNDAAVVRALRILNALVRDGHDAWPTRQNLKLPHTALQDPFDGKPMRVRRSKAGWTVYSVGINLVDDAGSIADRRDIGIGPEGK